MKKKILPATLLSLTLSAGCIPATRAQDAPPPPSAPSAARSLLPVAWDSASAQELLDYGRAIGDEGLDPADYALDRLAQAIASRNTDALDSAATRSFALLARDLADGHAPYDQRIDWFDTHPPLTVEATEQLMALALAERRVTAVLTSLSPANADYLALKHALAATSASDAARRSVLRVNMERWRWLPRSFGARYVLVNVPAFEVRLVDGGRTVATHRAIVGKPATPTPQLTANMIGVTLNPTWSVPSSIVAESIGKLIRNTPAAARARGFTWTSDGGGLHVRQKAGATNALGLVKFQLPNPHAIYLHDTPSRGLFDTVRRAYSHGCIRVQDPAGLAAEILAGTDWTADRIAAGIAAGDTVTAPLPTPLPVHIVYLTAVRGPDGGIRLLDDVYRRDGGVAAALGAAPLAAGTSAKTGAKTSTESPDCLCN